MLRVFYGEEDFLVHQSIQTLKKDFTEKNPQTLVEIFDGGESLVEDFFRSLSQGGGLFAQKKMVILQDIFEYSAGEQERILDFFKNKFSFSVDILVFITWRGKPRANKLLNYLKRKGELTEFKKITGLEIEKFILDKLKGLAEIEPGAVRKLRMILGENLWALDRELEKLVNFKSGEVIVEKDVDEMCSGKITVKIFDLVDAIGNQNKKVAFNLLNSLISQGADCFYILSMMIFQIRNLALVSSQKEKGIFSPQGIAQKTGLHPYVAQKTLSQLGRFDVGQIKKIYKKASSLDINSKSGRINIKEALEDFIIRI